MVRGRKQPRFPLSSLVGLFTLVVMLVLAACGGSTQQAQSHPTGHKLVVFVSGLGTGINVYSTKGIDTVQNNNYGLDSASWQSIQSFLQKKDFSDAQFMQYSYRGFNADGKPKQYYCQDTFNNQLSYDIALLNLQITQYLKQHPGTDVYIVSHSLGGVIAFAYMAQLVETTHSNAITDLGRQIGTLKGVAILDSPLGGITYSRGYDFASVIKALSCDPTLVTYETIADLQGIFQNATTHDQQGISASILSYINFKPGSFITNQQAAVDSANAGVRILVAGNTRDLLWMDVCPGGSNIMSTEFLNELGAVYSITRNGGSLYSRSFTSGDAVCGLSEIASNHGAALSNGDIQTAIWEVFTGQTLDKLSPVIYSSPATPQPTQEPTPMPTSVPTQPTPFPTPVQDPITSRTYTGQVVASGYANLTMTFTSVNGNNIQGNFSVADPLSSMSGTFSGTVTSDTIQFTVTPSDGSAPINFTGDHSQNAYVWSGQWNQNVSGGSNGGGWEVNPS